MAIARDGELIALKESHDKFSHSSLITLFIEEVLREAGIEKKSLHGVAISAGPGSFTGLRIGVATAKGICFALDKPLIAVGTLESMAAGMILKIRNQKPVNSTSNQLLFCPMIDARRMEVYSALFDLTGKQIRETKAEIIHEHSFSDYLQNTQVVFGGDGADKCYPLLKNETDALFLENFYPSARYMIGLAENKYRAGSFENIAYFEPFYLKDFIAGKPHVKGLK